jgi:two-component system NtrC family sensor kinase
MLMGQLLQQEKLAAIGQLVSGVAHELNNPLAGVMAFSQILLATPGVHGEERSAVETIHQEARRAAKIVSNLLTFARQHRPERTETDLNRVLMDTLELRRYALRVSQIEVELSLDSGVPATWADPFQLQQVLLNLLGNAEQALGGWSGERRITLRTSWARGANDPIVVSVSDTGPGVSPEQAARIFNPFYTTKPVGQGTGLGLSISDGIVREHGGRIRVESRPQGGATFFVELPHVAPPEVVIPPRAGADAAGMTGPA